VYKIVLNNDTATTDKRRTSGSETDTSEEGYSPEREKISLQSLMLNRIPRKGTLMGDGSGGELAPQKDLDEVVGCGQSSQNEE